MVKSKAKKTAEESDVQPRIWQVSIPITGVIYAEVRDCETEEDAIEKAMEMNFTIKDIAEWGMHRHVVQGNVFHGHTERASADEI